MVEMDGPTGGWDIRIDEKLYPAADGSQVVVVRGLGFGIERSEFICLIGPSGCGKSTTLRILLGLDQEFRGAISHRSPGLGRQPRIGVVFQEPRLLPWRSVEDNVRIALPPELRQTDLTPLFAELELGDFTARFPGELSLGLERRVALARALAIEPDLLVLDEPFVSLDDMAARRLRSLVAAAAARRAATVIMVTHNLPEALELADRLILLGPRPTRVIGERVIDRPRNGRSADWIAAMRIELAAAFPATIAA